MAGGLAAVRNWLHCCTWPSAIVAIVTQFLSDAATTALFAPVALPWPRSLADLPSHTSLRLRWRRSLHFDAIGHHGTFGLRPRPLSIMDFVKVGTPLTALIAVVVTTVSDDLAGLTPNHMLDFSLCLCCICHRWSVHRLKSHDGSQTIVLRRTLLNLRGDVVSHHHIGISPIATLVIVFQKYGHLLQQRVVRCPGS